MKTVLDALSGPKHVELELTGMLECTPTTKGSGPVTPMLGLYPTWAQASCLSSGFLSVGFGFTMLETIYFGPMLYFKFGIPSSRLRDILVCPILRQFF
jgi:hypothetical protein